MKVGDRISAMLREKKDIITKRDGKPSVSEEEYFRKKEKELIDGIKEKDVQRRRS